MIMQSADMPTSRTVHSKLPDAAAPQRTPQMRGIQVTGFMSCRRIFQMLVSAEAPFMPSSCALPLTPRKTSCFLPAFCACAATESARRAGAGAGPANPARKGGGRSVAQCKRGGRPAA
jgi:hypothetical protein